jgi:hypothetical protein
MWFAMTLPTVFAGSSADSYSSPPIRVREKFKSETMHEFTVGQTGGNKYMG